MLKSHVTTSRRTPTALLSTIPRNLSQYLMTLACTIPGELTRILYSTFSTTVKGRISNTSPPRRSETRVGASISSIKPGSSVTRSPRTSPRSSNKAPIASLTTKAHGQLKLPIDSVPVPTLRAPPLTNGINRMNRRKADFKFVYKYLEDEL